MLSNTVLKINGKELRVWFIAELIQKHMVVLMKVKSYLNLKWNKWGILLNYLKDWINQLKKLPLLLGGSYFFILGVI